MAVVATRLPFLGPGYGLDSDSWSVVATARHLAETGQYVPSRAPGYPLFELASALLWSAGVRSPFAWSLATALVSGLAALAFFRLAADHLSRGAAFGVSLVFALTAGIQVSSCEVLDYVWALSLFLLAFRAADRGGPIRAGILCGLAIGFRPTSGVLLAPLVVLAFRRAPAGQRLRAATRLALSAIAVGLACFAPVIPHYLAGFHPFDLTWSARHLLFAVRLWEPVGFLALVAGIFLAARRFARGPRPADPTILLASITGVAAVGLLFLRFPYEPGYLIPAVPLVLLVFGVLLDRRALAAIGVLMVAASVTTYSPSRGGWEAGGVFYAQSKRREDLAQARAAQAAVPSLEDRAVVLTRYLAHIIEFDLGRVTSYGFRAPVPLVDRGVLFLERFERADVERLQDDGRPVYYVPRVLEVLPETEWETAGRTYRIRPLPLGSS